jgi:hypothetical protein
MVSLAYSLTLRLLLCVALAAATAASSAQETAAEGEIPPAKPRYMGREIAQTMHFEGAP